MGLASVHSGRSRTRDAKAEPRHRRVGPPPDHCWLSSARHLTESSPRWPAPGREGALVKRALAWAWHWPRRHCSAVSGCPDYRQARGGGQQAGSPSGPSRCSPRPPRSLPAPLPAASVSLEFIPDEHEPTGKAAAGPGTLNFCPRDCRFPTPSTATTARTATPSAGKAASCGRRLSPNTGHGERPSGVLRVPSPKSAFLFSLSPSSRVHLVLYLSASLGDLSVRGCSHVTPPASAGPTPRHSATLPALTAPPAGLRRGR